MRGFAIVLLAGCGASSGSAGPSHPLACGPVISSVFGRSAGFAHEVWQGQQPDVSKELDEMMKKIEPIVEQSCRDDGWSRDLLACIDDITATDDPHKCDRYFTHDQAVNMARRMLTALMPPQAS